MLLCFTNNTTLSPRTSPVNEAFPFTNIFSLSICDCDSFHRYNGVEGLHIKVTEFVKDADCLVCGPGVLIELEKSITLKKVLRPRLLWPGLLLHQ